MIDVAVVIGIISGLFHLGGAIVWFMWCWWIFRNAYIQRKQNQEFHDLRQREFKKLIALERRNMEGKEPWQE